ncbi:hypothetical protein [Bacillus haynesii]|uniref:hypothetical protein n=1 Tax=Bacillus haynesii TaxID=1925021 RepID=UPI00227F90E1|nr:hypothetical protein [Bacillus haynesii]MCY7914716.1 hypothetical protein [Bacillus haynesii]MCY7926832.1 hypothetical protein [Bacillus haynesii]MCY8100407.1 hypothetical protein [Bacillus haynesii]MCY8468626.1 hypothetical protein [Bacillus haynesii]MCY8774472.1 hypothetical protein [Bacillus haynesii]
MKTFFSAAYCFLMYAFLAYLWLLFITAVIDRVRSFDHPLLAAGFIFIGTVLFYSLSRNFSASFVTTTAGRIAGSAAFILVVVVHFYVVPLC